jgi:hypothetical protein
MILMDQQVKNTNRKIGKKDKKKFFFKKKQQQ